MEDLQKVYKIIDYIGRILRHNTWQEFREVNTLIKYMEPHKMSVAEINALLRVTYPVRKHLKNWNLFLYQSRQYLQYLESPVKLQFPFDRK